MPLNTKPNIANPDEFYARLIEAHEGLSDDESTALNARLVLLLANHIGEHAVLSQAISAAQLPTGASD
jgi:hypothetical protein